MRPFLSFLIVLAGLIQPAIAQKQITVDDLWTKYAFMPQAAGGFNVMKDGIHYTDLEQDGDYQNIVKYDLKSGKKKGILVKGSDVKYKDKIIDISGYSFSPDETKLFFSIETQGIYRRSSASRNYVYDIKTGKTEELSEGGK